MASSNGNIFRVTGLLCGEFIGHRWIPIKKPVARSCDVFFDLHLNKRLSKQSWGWWFDYHLGNGVDNKHGDSDTPDEYVMDYLRYVRKNSALNILETALSGIWI